MSSAGGGVVPVWTRAQLDFVEDLNSPDLVSTAAAIRRRFGKGASVDEEEGGGGGQGGISPSVMRKGQSIPSSSRARDRTREKAD